jgi:hypothetical protein
LKNIGAITQAEFELGDLTIICVADLTQNDRSISTNLTDKSQVI